MTIIRPIGKPFYIGVKMVQTEPGETSSGGGAIQAAIRAPDGATLSAMAGGAANITVELRRAILENKYDFGQRLPSERNLAIHFRASRSTIREVLRRLEEEDLVIRRVGSGTFVNFRLKDEGDDVAEITGPLELIDVRFAIEPSMTRLAVVNAGARDMERLVEALARVEAAGNDAVLFSRADEAFHNCLARCSRNPLMIWLYNNINEIRRHSQWHRMRDMILSPENIAEYNAQHRMLVDALQSRDVETAVGVITRHLEKARRDLVGAARD
jgi:DNA-binding FadR family transcriptional regulator